MVSDTVKRVSNLLRGRIAELDEEEKQLRQALGNLDGGGQRPARRPRRKGRGRRAARGERRRQFLAAAEADPTATVPEIAKLIGVSANQAGSLARRLEASGAIKRSGRRIRLTAKAAG